MALDIPMVPVMDLLPQVMRLATVIDQAIIPDMAAADISAAASEFMARAKVFTDDLNLDLQQCVNDYPVPCVPGFVVHALSDVRINGRPLTARADAYLQGPHAPRLSGETFYWEPATQVLRLSRRNACGPMDAGLPVQRLFARMILAVSPSACEIPAALTERPEWRDAVQAGAMYRLCDVHQPPRAGYWHKRFVELVQKAIMQRVVTHAGTRPEQMQLTARNFISR